MPEEPQLQKFCPTLSPGTVYAVRFSSSPTLPLQKRRHLMPVPANRHRTPSPPPRPGIIIKKQSAPRVRAPLHRCILPLHDQLRRRPRDRGKQPLQPALSPNKLQPPPALPRHQLIVSFRDPQNLVDRRYPSLWKIPPFLHRRKHRPHTFPQPQNLQQHRIHRPRLAPLQRLQPHPALFTHHPRIHQKLHKLRPRKVMRHRHQIGKVQCQSSGNQFWRCCSGFQSAPFSDEISNQSSF